LICFTGEAKVPLSIGDLFSKFFDPNFTVIESNPDPATVINHLDQILTFFGSFNSRNKLPLSEFLRAKLDVALAFLINYNFKEHQNKIENKMMLIFEFLGFCPPDFMERFVKLGIIEFICGHLQNSPISDGTSFGSAFMFITNFSESFESFIDLLNEKNVFDFVFEYLHDFIINPYLRSNLITFFVNLSKRIYQIIELITKSFHEQI
jgi:hypothetical protein